MSKIQVKNVHDSSGGIDGTKLRTRTILHHVIDFMVFVLVLLEKMIVVAVIYGRERTLKHLAS
jgi:hypothetical protein